MSRQQTFSHLTLIATVLIAASATCFAQSESSNPGTEAAGAVAVATNNLPKVEKRLGNFETPANPVSNPVAAESHTGFSVAKFMTSARMSVAPASWTLTPKVNNEFRLDLQQLRAEEFSEPAKTRKISFVPSRGQKLPN